MKILAFAAALRAGSFNRKLIHQAASALKEIPGVEIDLADFRDFEMPIYDGDAEENVGLPGGANQLVERVRRADAVIVSTPEYNGSIPGTLKNAIDWSSRADENPWERKPVLLLGASPGALGAVRGLWHTRVPFEAMSAFVYPEMFGLPRADQAFDASGAFTDPKTQKRLQKLIQGFVDFSRRQKG